MALRGKGEMETPGDRPSRGLPADRKVGPLDEPSTVGRLAAEAEHLEAAAVERASLGEVWNCDPDVVDQRPEATYLELWE